MPTVLRVRGHRSFFFSDERQEPAHVHVESTENYAKFWLNPVALADSVGYDAREIHVLRELVIQHEEMLQRAWDDFFDGG